MLALKFRRARTAGREDFAGRALDIASTLREPVLEVGINYYLAQTAFVLGDYPTAADSFRRTVAGVPPESTTERFGLILLPAVTGRAFVAMMLAFMGEFSEAAPIAAEAVAIGETTEHPFSLVLARWCAGVACGLAGDLAGADSHLRRAMQVCEEWSIRYVSPPPAATAGWVQALSGMTDDGLRVLEDCDTRARSVGFMPVVLFIQPMLVEAQMLSARYERAERSAREALGLARHHGTRGYEAMLRRLLGQIRPNGTRPTLAKRNAIIATRSVSLLNVR